MKLPDIEMVAALVHQAWMRAKQLGSKPTTDHRTRPDGEPSYWTQVLKDRKGGDWEEWKEDLRVREFPSEVRPT